MFGEEYTVSRGNPDIRSMTQALNGYGYALNNPNRFADPYGKNVTEWDEEHLNPYQLRDLYYMTRSWKNASPELQQIFRERAEYYRAQYRKPYEHTNADGETYEDAAERDAYLKAHPDEVAGDMDYIFYTTVEGSDFTEQANWGREQLEALGHNVQMLEVNDVNHFITEWNGMGRVNGKRYNINIVAIYSHGNDFELIFSEYNNNAISSTGLNNAQEPIAGFDNLEIKTVSELHILSCNGGNLLIYEHEGQNLASVFSTKIDGGRVYAYDGQVSFGKSLYDRILDITSFISFNPVNTIFYNELFNMTPYYPSRLATNQNNFNAIAQRYHSDHRPLGVVLYQNGKYIPKNSSSYVEETLHL